ncbi:MAG: hypothetical protein NT180_05210 [Actinobacteria bacterium]|nr:hypothetical protein [Actinomycetota bacterium]
MGKVKRCADERAPYSRNVRCAVQYLGLETTTIDSSASHIDRLAAIGSTS